jgi:RNA polymerase sigma factor (sigma-70 family)
MTFDEFISRNYSQLVQIASRVFSRTQLDPAEVISELYLDVTENKREIRETESDYLNYSKRWIKSRLTWTGGNVIKTLRITDKKTEDIEKHKFRLSVEPSEIKTEVVIDLELIGFSQDQAEKIESCLIFSRSLPLYQKRLFELYYQEGLSIQQIASSCDLPKTAIHRDIVKLNKLITQNNGKTYSSF